MAVHLRTCPLCEACCGLVVHTEGDRVSKIRGDEEDPFSRGYICPKGVALADIHHDPDRLKHPLRRTGNQWRKVDWDEAFEETAKRIVAIQREHGNDSVAVYLGNPTIHNLGAMLSAPGFVRALSTKNRYSATSVDQLAHHVAAWAMFGHQLLLPVPDIDHTSFFLILGGNPLASNGSLMTAPDVKNRLRAIRERGGHIVLVDPRRTETAEVADRHLFIRPGSDVYLLLAMLQLIFAEDLARPGRLAEITDGLHEVEQLVKPWTAERASRETGIAAGDIEVLARSFAAAPSAVAYARVGGSTQLYGGLCQWLVQVLNIVTGNLDRPGGALFTTPALDALGFIGPGHYARWRSRVRDLPEFGGELPVAALAEEIDTPGERQVRGFVTHAGNPVLSTPNGRRLERALSQLDFYVAIDFYKNETTRHAHLILPPTGPLEHDHYDAALYMLAIRNFARYSEAVFDRPEGTKHDHEIFGALTTRLLRERGVRFGKRVAASVAAAIPPSRLVDVGLRAGPWGLRKGLGGLSLGRLRAEPHGVDLGPLASQLPDRLRTEKRRIDAAPGLFVDELRRLGTYGAPHGLSLIGRRDLRSNNSWMHNTPSLVSGRERCTLQLHPVDARERKIADGVRVRVRSRVGEIELPAEVTEDMMPGVVCIPHGWGHDRPGVDLGVATQHAGASINDLTDDARVDGLTGAAAFSGVPVEVEPV
jgi:anaerobic selenocysteine-containing dehydrogenase